MLLSNFSQFAENYFKCNFLFQSVYSSKEPTHSNCNTTHFSDQNQVKVVQDCERRRPDQCNKLQERFNALTREKNLLGNRNTELTNMIRKVEEERDRLKMKLRGEKINQAVF